MKQIVADTGPLLHLHEAQALHLLPLVGLVSVPVRVLTEFRKHAPHVFSATLPAWLTVSQLSPKPQQRATAWQKSGLLHSGEAEALALAEESGPDWFLTDDAAARLMAESLAMEAHGSLGVVLWCAARHLIPKVEAELFLANLEKSSLWLSPRVRTEAHMAIAKLFAP
jgi:predicted nucleic acid-binding protein